jgi:hypothetical protein
MKNFFPIFLFLCYAHYSSAQITSPLLKAHFGVDAEQRANYISTTQVLGNDDWFLSIDPGSGQNMIDTSGASAVYQRYFADESSLNELLVRRMSYPTFSKVNGVLLMDAVFVRDFHGDDSTIFASGSNKNGMTPANWSCPVAQSVPDKNEILDIFMHVRRDGISATDSLWMLGAVSIENTNGNRYFDFEMFQTDIFYNRNTQSFTGYGPDAGHTSWEFDANGNVIKAGDIILTAEYSSSTLTLIEARIWIDRDNLNLTPTNFSWGGLFDGANTGSKYGYASILPKVAGAFYNGLQNSGTAWGGPFGIVFADNRIGRNYSAGQFMEFAVNLTKLGLDPVTLLGGSTCDRPFQKVMVKTRASTSFTAALKDFVGPFSFFESDSAKLFTDVPVFCGVVTVSNIRITNPVATATYHWYTPDGHILDSSNIHSIFVDAPGTYIVYQKSNSDCPIFAADTFVIRFDVNCGVLMNSELDFKAAMDGPTAVLRWKNLIAENIIGYQLQRSEDGIRFLNIGAPHQPAMQPTHLGYMHANDVSQLLGDKVFYRLQIKSSAGQIKYSPTLSLKINNYNKQPKIIISPNPAYSRLQINIATSAAQWLTIQLLDATGKIHRNFKQYVTGGSSSFVLEQLQQLPQGIYQLVIQSPTALISKKILIGSN